MRVFIIACLIVLAVAESKDETSTAAPAKSPEIPENPSEKPQAFQHQSSLKDSANQHLDSQQESSSEEYRQLNSDEVKQLLLKVTLFSSNRFIVLHNITALS